MRKINKDANPNKNKNNLKKIGMDKLPHCYIVKKNTISVASSINSSNKKKIVSYLETAPPKRISFVKRKPFSSSQVSKFAQDILVDPKASVRYIKRKPKQKEVSAFGDLIEELHESVIQDSISDDILNFENNEVASINMPLSLKNESQRKIPRA